MSRIGKNPITIPANTEVTISEEVVTVKGPLGQLSLSYKPVIDIKLEDGAVLVIPKNDKISTRALWGTYGSHILNMIRGVNKEYEKKLKIEGVGFRAEMKGTDSLMLSVGFSHQVEMKVPVGLTCVVEKDIITISGISKEEVGQFSAKVRAKKKPEPYKGKGIRYIDEVVRRKEGKKSL